MHRVDQTRKGGELSRLAARLCQNPEFQQWLNTQSFTDLTVTVEGAQDAAELVRLACGIQSRAELDHDAGAANIFHKRFRRPFAERAQC